MNENRTCPFRPDNPHHLSFHQFLINHHHSLRLPPMSPIIRISRYASLHNLLHIRCNPFNTRLGLKPHNRLHLYQIIWNNCRDDHCLFCCSFWGNHWFNCSYADWKVLVQRSRILKS